MGTVPSPPRILRNAPGWKLQHRGDAPNCSAHLVAPQAQAHPGTAVWAVAAAGDENWSKNSGFVGEVGPFWGGWELHAGLVGSPVGVGEGSSAGLIPAPPTEIREAFKVFDRDGNGFISKQELGTAMRSLGYMPNEVELEVIIQRLDMDGRSPQPGMGTGTGPAAGRNTNPPVFPPHMLDTTRGVG